MNNDVKEWCLYIFTPSANGHGLTHAQLKVARAHVFTSAAHALAHPSCALARVRRVQIFKLFSYAESDIWIQFK